MRGITPHLLFRRPRGLTLSGTKYLEGHLFDLHRLPELMLILNGTLALL